jgi:hypothetical protein
MVFWLLNDSTPQPPSLLSKSSWRGLAVVLDTNSETIKQSFRVSPRQSGDAGIFAVYNDGSSQISPLFDENLRMLGSCNYDPRNSESNIMRVTYDDSKLLVC